MKHDHFLSLSFYSFIAPVRSLKWIRKRRSETFFLCFLPLRCPQDLSPPFSPGQLNFVCLRQLLFLFLTFYIFLFLPVRARCNWNSSFNGPSRFLQFSSFFLILLLLLFLKKRTKREGRKKRGRKTPKGSSIWTERFKFKKEKKFPPQQQPQMHMRRYVVFSSAWLLLAFWPSTTSVENYGK